MNKLIIFFSSYLSKLFEFLNNGFVLVKNWIKVIIWKLGECLLVLYIFFLVGLTLIFVCMFIVIFVF